MRRALMLGLVAIGLAAGGCNEGLSPDTTSAPLPGTDDPSAAQPNDAPPASAPTPGTPRTNDRQGQADPPMREETESGAAARTSTYRPVSPVEHADPTNTGLNERDAGDAAPPLPTDQSNSDRDLEVVTAIRQKITSTDGMSLLARNVKVVVADGKISLRGPVASAAERQTIEQIARAAAGDSLTVDSDLDVARER